MSALYLEHDIPEDTREARKAAEELLASQGCGAQFVYFASTQQHATGGTSTAIRVRGYASPQ